jgi:hypothetical protein
MRNPSSTLTESARPRLARGARLIAPLAVAVAVVAGITTACSSSTASSHPHAAGRAHSGGGSLAFSTCMRSHGVHNFPDPSAGPNGGSQINVQPGSGIDPNSPAYQAAQRSCQSLLPAGKTTGSVSPAVRAQVLRYAACIRSHGEPTYPDPTFNGNAINFGNLSGINPNSAQYQSALRACASLNPMNGHGGSK